MHIKMAETSDCNYLLMLNIYYISYISNIFLLLVCTLSYIASFILYINYMLSRATYPGDPSYGGVRTWVEGSQLHYTDFTFTKRRQLLNTSA